MRSGHLLLITPESPKDAGKRSRRMNPYPGVAAQGWERLVQGRKPLINLVGNFSYRNNLRLNRKAYADFKSYVKAGD